MEEEEQEEEEESLEGQATNEWQWSQHAVA